MTTGTTGPDTSTGGIPLDLLNEALGIEPLRRCGVDRGLHELDADDVDRARANGGGGFVACARCRAAVVYVPPAPSTVARLDHAREGD